MMTVLDYLFDCAAIQLLLQLFDEQLGLKDLELNQRVSCDLR
jgi:hypothetical protein